MFRGALIDVATYKLSFYFQTRNLFFPSDSDRLYSFGNLKEILLCHLFFVVKTEEDSQQ